MKHRTLVSCSLAVAAALAAAVGGAPNAHAKGDQTGSLGAGGVARGDISKDAGETDRVLVDLEEGATLDVAFASAFAPSFSLAGPGGEPVDLGVPAASRLHVRDLVVPATGTYTFTVASAEGDQGLYTLSVRQKWARTVPIEGAGTVTLDVAMPATSRLSCSVARARGAAGSPSIDSLLAPGGAELLAAPVEAKRGVARLAATDTAVGGVHALTISASDGTSAWSGKVTRSVPRVRPTKLDLTNGIDRVSYAAAGLDDFFSRRCGGCHGWAKSYSGMKSKVRKSLPMMRSGQMPANGARIPSDQLALIQSWVDTGLAR